MKRARESGRVLEYSRMGAENPTFRLQTKQFCLGRGRRATPYVLAKSA
jgi:hypothetical protein